MEVDEGDPAFDELLRKLAFVKADNWALLYQDRETGAFWDVTYPRGEMHGGGPRRLRLLTLSAPDVWEPYPVKS